MKCGHKCQRRLFCLPEKLCIREPSRSRYYAFSRPRTLLHTTQKLNSNKIFSTKNFNMSDSMYAPTQLPGLIFCKQILINCRRKGLGEQAGEKLTPQSQKSTGQVVSENVSSTSDKIAGAVQPSKALSSQSQASSY